MRKRHTNGRILTDSFVEIRNFAGRYRITFVSLRIKSYHIRVLG